MPMQREREKRIMLLLRAGIVSVELLAIVAWLSVQLLFGGAVSTPAAAGSLLVLFLLMSLQFLTGSNTVWRLSGLAFVIVYALIFRQFFDAFPALYELYALAFTVMVVVGASLLIRGTLDYLLVGVSIWLIIWPFAVPVSPSGASILGIFFGCSLLVGFINNVTYVRALKSILALEQHYKVMSEVDFLTSIYNRRALIEQFQRFLDTRRGGFFLMIDVDNFKRVNDHLGHHAGDQVLCVLAACLTRMQGSYCVGRLGGEEFGVILDTTDLRAAMKSSQDLLNQVRDCDLAPTAFTISAGMVAFSQGDDVSTILREADRNLYAAKRAGKDRLEYSVAVCDES